jgi:hypothetical protein
MLNLTFQPHAKEVLFNHDGYSPAVLRQVQSPTPLQANARSGERSSVHRNGLRILDSAVFVLYKAIEEIETSRFLHNRLKNLVRDKTRSKEDWAIGECDCLVW